MVTFSVTVRDPNSWNARTGIHEERNSCGHRHKTSEAANKCCAKLTEWRCLCGRTAKGYCGSCHTPNNSTSAAWWGAEVEENI
jgi:hypothetical protein